MFDSYCSVCGCKKTSKSKGRPVMCECDWVAINGVDEQNEF